MYFGRVKTYKSDDMNFIRNDLLVQQYTLLNIPAIVLYCHKDALQRNFCSFLLNASLEGFQGRDWHLEHAFCLR